VFFLLILKIVIFWITNTDYEQNISQYYLYATNKII